MTEERKQRAREMFEMRLEGATYQDIADKYGVSKQRVNDILHGVAAPRKVCSRIVYKGLRRWMDENNITIKELHKMIFTESKSDNAMPTRHRLRGKLQFKLSEIILIIEKSGMTFEELFMEVDECQNLNH